MINGLLTQEMPREKLINLGPENLTDVELLAIILRVGTKEKNVIELSREIITKFDVSMVSRKTYEELLEFRGINKAKACQIVAMFELSRRFSLKTDKKIKLNKSSDIFEYVKSDFANLGIEKVMAVFVNSKNLLIKKEFVFTGSINYSVIEPRDIIKKALNYNASGFFLIHNHPSGDTSPSNDDIEITNVLKKICENLNVRFLDHLIIGDEYYSFYDNDQI